MERNSKNRNLSREISYKLIDIRTRVTDDPWLPSWWDELEATLVVALEQTGFGPELDMLEATHAEV